jgi:monofunctional biosynthetic peptidoglycan transglycosylase
VRAVVVSEDGRFCDHWGIDLAAIKEAIERSSGGTLRGASTISMQVTKNLFLWPQKSYLRKVIELPLTLLIELVWPKWRILEIYLNVAEWGPGIYGAEAAARHHFRKPASRLGEGEAALLAASLPNPALRDAGDPGPRTERKARTIQARMRISGAIAACVTNRFR